MERLKFITQKRSSLKSQLTTLQNLIVQNKLDYQNANLRLGRIKVLWENYEELHDEFEISHPEDERLADIDEIRDKYYALAVSIGSMEITSSSRNELNNSNSSTIAPAENKMKKLKLPVAELPKFSGDLNKWLSYKNTFETMIDKREDITDLQKFLYLKDSLKGEALAKLSIFDISSDNYRNAWNLLRESYERKRILIAKHLDAILDMPAKVQPNRKELIQLVDSVKQRITALESLGVVVEKSIITRMIERALPSQIRIKWEETLSLDEFPSIAKIYEFITETAYRIATLTSENEQNTEAKKNKRQGVNREPPFSKSRKIMTGEKVFTTTAIRCPMCKIIGHQLYNCKHFLPLDTSKRWEEAKRAKVCRKCLKAHTGECTYNNCRKCNKNHNVLLHEDQAFRRHNFLKKKPFSGGRDKNAPKKEEETTIK